MKQYQLHFQKNIRDIGGLTGYNGRHIKYGKLFRGGALIKVKEEDLPTIESFHLTDVVDFRSQSEFIYRPDYQINGVRYHNFPTLKKNDDKNKDLKKSEDGNLLWFINEGDTGHGHLQRIYGEFVVIEESINAYKEFFKLLQDDEDRVIYFHCSQGKDRAGFAAYLLETALGVSYEDALEDYLLSNIAMELRVQILIDQVKNQSFYDEGYHNSLLDVFSAKKEYLDTAIEKMNELYGGVINFMEKVLDVDIQKLREKYLEE